MTKGEFMEASGIFGCVEDAEWIAEKAFHMVSILSEHVSGRGDDEAEKLVSITIDEICLLIEALRKAEKAGEEFENKYGYIFRGDDNEADPPMNYDLD